MHNINPAIIRALRTFIGAFLALVPAQALLGWASGSQPIDTSALRGAAVAGIAAVIAFIWRAYLDPTAIPSMKDSDQPPHVA